MRRRMMVLSVLGVIGLAVGCAPPPTTSADLSGFAQVCAVEYPISEASMTIVDAEPGADMYWTTGTYYPVGMFGLPEWVGSTVNLNDVQVGNSYPLTFATGLDQGRCLNVFDYSGVTYRISVQKALYDPRAYLLWTGHLTADPYRGWLPCGSPDSGGAPNGCIIVT